MAKCICIELHIKNVQMQANVQSLAVLFCKLVDLLMILNSDPLLSTVSPKVCLPYLYIV